MVFSWDAVNRDHIARQGVSPDEAEEVVAEATNPFPRTVEDDKFVVWGATGVGRYLQVIYVLKSPHEITYESLSDADWIAIEAGELPK